MVACRLEIDQANVHRITFDSPKAHAIIGASQDEVALPKRAVQYNEMSREDIQAMAKVESFGQYGAKVSTNVLLIPS